MTDFEKVEDEKRKWAEDDKRIKPFEQVYIGMAEQRSRGARGMIDEETGLSLRSPREGITPRGGNAMTPRSVYQQL